MSNIIGQTLLNQYRVDSFIASGGMGAVYKVWDLKRNVPLAMKVLQADLIDDPSAFKYFQREARALQKLRHPNIVPFYGIYQTEGISFILEQFIDGPSLRDILRKQPGGIAMPDALAYMQALCSALGYAHANGVIHCDVKPANVMVDSGGHIYLADFGIARHAQSTATTIAGSGTPAYMAPEQIMRQTVTPATDIYALGILLFELLTGQRPFRGNEPETLAHGSTSGERIIYAHLNLQPRDPSEINPAIPASLSALILKAMSKSPQDRYASTGELLGALGLDNDQAPNSYPPSIAQVSSIPRALQANWLKPLGAAVFILIALSLILLANSFSTATAPAVDLTTYMIQALTDVRVTQSAIAGTPTMAPPTITESPVPVPSETRMASPTSQPHVLLVDPERVAEFSSAKHLTDLAQETYYLADYNRMNETLKFTVNLKASQPLIWKANWCAKNKSILNSNLQSIKFEFSLNGEDIPLDRFESEPYINKDGGIMDGWSCMAHQAVLTDWQPGIYQVSSKFTYLAPINDGLYDFPAGWKISLYTVTVK